MAFLLSHAHNANSYFLLIGLVMFCSCFNVCLSSANNTITSSTSILDRNHETITSNNTDFKLGFFSPPKSTKRYLGIWYLSESYIIWIANRDNPLNDSSGVVKLQKDGNLVILNAENSVIWSTSISNSNFSSSIGAINSTAKLDDTGNLIIRDDNSGAIIWESFSHPADAAVPSMKLASNKVTGKKISYVSRKSDSDPSSGNFSVSLERLNAPQVFIWHGKTPYWRTGPWNGRVFLGSPRMTIEYLRGWSLDFDVDGTSFITYNFVDPKMFGVLQLTPHGTLKLVQFFNKKEFLSVEVDQNECDIYGKCGPLGNCDNSSIPICSCFQGYEPRNAEEWSRKNWTGGCVRKLPLQCEKLKAESGVKQDGFLVHQNMKVPDFYERFNGDQNRCGEYCLANCSCLAYAYDPHIGCMYWSDDLIDLQHFPNGGIDLYIRIPAELVAVAVQKNNTVAVEVAVPVKKERGHMALIIAIAGIIGACTIVVCIYLIWRKCTAKHKGSGSQSLILGEQKQMKLDELPLFDFDKLETATNKFNLGNMLGKGGFGPVYKGILKDGQEIAVKRLSKASGQGKEEFMNEVAVISKLQHRNLVKIIGCCIERNEQMLVYEFMPNKSLDGFLFDPLQKKALDWKMRFNIIEGIARGILYLHRDSRLRIIHRDLKASNILLDGKMTPKISDFGLARIFKDEEDDEANTRRVVGTYGYMPPEYAMEGLFSEKSDVYSFGVLLLEIVSGRRNTSFYNNEESLSLIGFAWKLWIEENIGSLIDQDIWDPCFETSMLRCIHIGLLCVQEIPRERPTVSTVVSMLISEITHLPPPGKIAFVHKHNFQSAEASQKSQSNSNNNVTMSEIQGR